MPRLSCTRLAVVGQGRGSLRDAILSTATTATLAYIAAVEGVSGDNQRLEDGVLAVMVTFANWRIPLGGACCLMTGPRTLAGALVPMVGPAPTGVNLVEGDYNRSRVQLDGINKRIASNINTDALPHLDNHASVFDLRAATEWSGTGLYIFGGSTSSGTVSLTVSGVNTIRVRSNSTSFIDASNAGGAQAAGSRIAARNATHLEILSGNDIVRSATGLTDTAAPPSEPINFGASSQPSQWTPIAPAAYSLGPYIAPTDLDTQYKAAVNAIATALA